MLTEVAAGVLTLVPVFRRNGVLIPLNLATEAVPEIHSNSVCLIQPLCNTRIVPFIVVIGQVLGITYVVNIEIARNEYAWPAVISHHHENSVDFLTTRYIGSKSEMFCLFEPLHSIESGYLAS